MALRVGVRQGLSVAVRWRLKFGVRVSVGVTMRARVMLKPAPGRV